MDISNAITRDLDWREKEIGAMRLLLTSSGVTSGQKSGLLRAAWAMLYAHYEGFCKNTLTAFFDAIAVSGIVCRDLPHSTKLFAIGDKLKRLKHMTNEDLLINITNFQTDTLSLSPQFPEIDTQSNLWPSVLIDLLELADLNSDKVREHELKLKTLVSRRNKIAHGEKNIITEVGYYRTYEDAVYDVMYDLALQVDNRLSRSPYFAQQ
jgi:hypothetical protein